jgi:succinate dehydrogenase / fumarate reductase flavoprotein subunit
MQLDSKSPTGPIEKRWEDHRFHLKLVNPANKRKYTVLVVGSGLAGGSAAATLAELGYNVKCFCFQDSPRRAHSIAAQGGINAAKNYHNDGDSVYRLFYDTVKGGDFRSREANVYRLARSASTSSTSASPRACPSPANTAGCSTTAPSAARRSRAPSTPRTDGPAACCSAPTRRSNARSAPAKCQMFPRTEMLDLVVVDGNARGIVTRNLVTGKIERTSATPWCSAPAATATSFISPPTPRAATSPPSGAPTSAARSSPTPASRRSIPPASRCPASTSRSSL